MTPDTFRDCLARLCWSQRGFATFLGVAHNTVHRWALGQAVIPARIGVWLERLLAHIERNPPPE